MHVETDHKRPSITFAEMKKFLVTGWGELGALIADTWAAFNRDHFGGKLSPLPIVLTATSPFGQWVGLTHCDRKHRRAHLIELTWPRGASPLRAGRSTLLHEMIHQHLAERGRDPSHDSEDWCNEIMRVHHELTGGADLGRPAVHRQAAGQERSFGPGRAPVRSPPESGPEDRQEVAFAKRYWQLAAGGIAQEARAIRNPLPARTLTRPGAPPLGLGFYLRLMRSIGRIEPGVQGLGLQVLLTRAVYVPANPLGAADAIAPLFRLGARAHAAMIAAAAALADAAALAGLARAGLGRTLEDRTLAPAEQANSWHGITP